MTRDGPRRYIATMKSSLMGSKTTAPMAQPLSGMPDKSGGAMAMPMASAIPMATATAVAVPAGAIQVPGMPAGIATFEGDVQEAKIMRTVQKNRACTDIFWAVLFLAALAVCMCTGVKGINSAMDPSLNDKTMMKAAKATGGSCYNSLQDEKNAVLHTNNMGHAPCTSTNQADCGAKARPAGGRRFAQDDVEQHTTDTHDMLSAAAWAMPSTAIIAFLAAVVYVQMFESHPR